MTDIVHTLTIGIPDTIPHEAVIAIMGGDFRGKSHEIEVTTGMVFNEGCKGSLLDPPEPDSLEAITRVEDIAWAGVEIMLGHIDLKLRGVDTFNTIFNAIIEAEEFWRREKMEGEYLAIVE